jgi:hypothetical protein
MCKYIDVRRFVKTSLTLRSLEALRLATALDRYELDVVLTYDARMAATAEDLGLAVLTPK